jgi:hypothetical protein
MRSFSVFAQRTRASIKCCVFMRHGFLLIYPYFTSHYSLLSCRSSKINWEACVFGGVKTFFNCSYVYFPTQGKCGNNFVRQWGRKWSSRSSYMSTFSKCKDYAIDIKEIWLPEAVVHRTSVWHYPVRIPFIAWTILTMVFSSFLHSLLVNFGIALWNRSRLQLGQ